jgi:hypothetical protein
MARLVPSIHTRTEKVDLRPGGATVAVTVPADNPFEASGRTTVVTQHTADIGFAGGGAQRTTRIGTPLNGGTDDLMPQTRTAGRDMQGRGNATQDLDYQGQELAGCVGCGTAGLGASPLNRGLAGFVADNKAMLIAGAIAAGCFIFLRKKRK